MHGDAASSDKALDGNFEATQKTRRNSLPVRLSVGWEMVRWLSVLVYFLNAAISIHIGQIICLVLYPFSKTAFNNYVAFTKQAAGLLIISLTDWWCPTTLRLTGDSSVSHQLHQRNGRIECTFDKRAVLVSNHQIYTDWSYLWFTAYMSNVTGHIYIMLKDSLKWIPVLGPGLQLFGFIFMSRKWANDEAIMQRQLDKLNTSADSTNPQAPLDPAWLLVFPEGTNLSANQRRLSAAYAAKSGQQDMLHTVLPRSTGLRLCLMGLAHTVEYMYDCTIGYEAIGHGEYAAETYTLRSTYFQGRNPASVSMHWRRFRIADMPLHDADDFHQWLLRRWREKDELLEAFMDTGRFTANEGDCVEQRMGVVSQFEYLKVWMPCALALALLAGLWALLSLLF
ncbi:hypothetical protein MBLNU230_g4142t1 [Neophaeotheca triangularis]